MEPINNQQLNLTQMQSPVLQTAQQTPPIPSVSVQPQFMPQQPAMKNNSKKLILLLVILSLMIGIVVYIMFAKNQLNYTQKTSTDYNTNTEIPSYTPSPSQVIQEDILSVDDPESELKSIENDIQSL